MLNEKGERRMKIGYRTLKTAVGASLAVLLAQWMGLQFPSSAGILTILCIQPTKKRSLRNAYARFAACLLSLLFGAVFFETVGYHPFSIFLLILFFIPLLVWLKIQEGFVSSSVIVFHLYTVKSFSLAFLQNELLIITLGVGMALIMNAYMPSLENDLLRYREKVEANFKRILKELATYLRNPDSIWDGQEIIETEDLLNEAKSLSIKKAENHLFTNKDEHYRYFQMREDQFRLLERLVPLVSTLPHTVSQGEKIADFLNELSDHVHSGNTAYIFLDKLNQMRTEFETTDLPKTRTEFETRATLFYFVSEMERYLLIKHRFGRDAKDSD